jgi:hypothetical protein
MKIKQKREWTFGNLITTACAVWGVARAEKMVRVAINTNVVVFRAAPQFCFSSAKGRFL